MDCVDGEVREVKLREVYLQRIYRGQFFFMERLRRWVASFATTDKNVELPAVCRSDGCKVFDVHEDTNNILAVRAVKTDTKQVNNA